MTSEIHSVGLGVYILSTIWLFTFVLCIVSVRTGQLIGAFAFIISSVITLVLVLIPRIPEAPTSEAKVYDPLFVLRYCILAFIIICLIGGCVGFIMYHCMAPVVTKKLRHWLQ